MQLFTFFLYIFVVFSSRKPRFQKSLLYEATIDFVYYTQYNAFHKKTSSKRMYIMKKEKTL